MHEARVGLRIEVCERESAFPDIDLRRGISIYSLVFGLFSMQIFVALISGFNKETVVLCMYSENTFPEVQSSYSAS